MKHRPKDNFIPAQASNHERAKENRARVRKIKSPDLSKLTAIEVPGIRATFYPANKKALKRRIKQLKLVGLSYKINL